MTCCPRTGSKTGATDHARPCANAISDFLAEYADALSDRAEHTQAVDIASAVTAADPFHEGAHRTLMAALAASGRRYEAVAVFDRLREALTAEYAADS